METILNRLRGTGTLVYFFTFTILNEKILSVYNRFKKVNISKLDVDVKLTGTMVYAMYYSILYYVVTDSYWMAIVGFVSFLAAESKGWGEWVGILVSRSPITPESVKKGVEDDEGKGFPYVHYIANAFIKEDKSYYKYCQLALGVRGLLWGILLYGGLFAFGYISIFIYFIASSIYAIAFPFACYLAKLFPLNYKYGKISIIGGWETQEFYYGFIHMVANIIVIYSIFQE